MVILHFANRRGALGDQVILRHRRDSGRAGYVSGESYSAWTDALSEYKKLDRIWQDVRLIPHPDAFSNMAVGASRGRIRIERNADSIAIRFDVDYHGVAGFAYVAWPGADDEELRERLTGVSDVEVAGYFVAREVNRRLQMVNPVVLPFRGGLLRLVPQTLLAALYLRFAQGFAGGPGRPERPCDFEECRLPFTPERRDHRYHTKACKEAAGYRRRLATRDENDLAAALAPGDTSH